MISSLISSRLLCLLLLVELLELLMMICWDLSSQMPTCLTWFDIYWQKQRVLIIGLWLYEGASSDLIVHAFKLALGADVLIN